MIQRPPRFTPNDTHFPYTTLLRSLPSNMEVPYEVSGIVKKASYYDDIYGSGHWRSSNIISLAIGQGELGVTPLQMANMMAAIANKGYYYRPHLVKSIGDEKYVPPEFTEKIHTGIDPEHFEIVHQGMQIDRKSTRLNSSH